MYVRADDIESNHMQLTDRFQSSQMHSNIAQNVEQDVTAFLDGIEFADDEMADGWYNGSHPLAELTIITDRLYAIHNDAFSGRAFSLLAILKMIVGHGSLGIEQHAFRGLKFLTQLLLKAMHLDFPIGTFVAFCVPIWIIQCDDWPSDVNLNDMFASELYRQLKALEVKNVRMPQTKFRLLHATNFTTFRRLQSLYLINCGIETINERTFDTIGRTLTVIILKSNRIKVITLDTFRRIFESKFLPNLRIDDNLEQFVCTCELIEMDIMQCPFRLDATRMCVKCVPAETGFVGSACGIYRDVNLKAFHVPVEIKHFLRTIVMRLSVQNTSILLRTNFTSHSRMLLVDLDAMRGMDCNGRSAGSHFKCLKLDKFVDRLDFGDIDEIRQTRFLSITAIPILHRFGARPMHTMTVRQPIGDGAAWRPNDLWIGAASIVIFMIWSLIVGCVCFFYKQRRWKTQKTPPSIDLPLSSVYGSSLTVKGHDTTYYNDNNYDEIVEGNANDNYIVIINDATIDDNYHYNEIDDDATDDDGYVRPHFDLDDYN